MSPVLVAFLKVNELSSKKTRRFDCALMVLIRELIDLQMFRIVTFVRGEFFENNLSERKYSKAILLGYFFQTKLFSKIPPRQKVTIRNISEIYHVANSGTITRKSKRRLSL